MHTLAELSIVKVLISGSSIRPASLNEIEFHLREGDKQSWDIIRNNLSKVSEEKVHQILEQVTQTEGIRFSTVGLIDMLLSLPGGENISGLLTYRVNNH